MKASVSIANAQPTLTVSGLKVGQALQLSNKEVIARLADAVYLVIQPNGSFAVYSNSNQIDQATGFELAATSAITLVL